MGNEIQILEDLKFLFSIIKTVSVTFEQEKRLEKLKKKYKLNDAPDSRGVIET